MLKPYPAPVDGWNARDSLASMKPTAAIDLENFFPGTSYVEMRGGRANHLTAMTGAGKTLAVYNKLTGTNEMFCATASGVYNASAAGAAGASLAARTSGKHQWAMFNDGTNSYLIMVNGVDKPLYYNGTTWVAVDAASSPALTGLTTTLIIGVTVFKGRLIFIEKDTLKMWYLAAGAAGGALSSFSFAGVAKKGGYLMAAAAWTIDAGDGPDDRAVFVTSEGEILVYVGTDPASASTWSLVGVYETGKPLGRKCLTKIGGDLLVINQNGAFTMSQAVQSSAIDYRRALSANIEPAFVEAARSYSATFGWTPVIFPSRSALIINVPITEDGEHEQYVMNTITKAWCRFKEWDAEDFAVYNSELYYVAGTTVHKAWTGTSDGGADIVAYAKPAFTYLTDPGRKKRVQMLRQTFQATASFEARNSLDVDYSDREATGSELFSLSGGFVWNTGVWGTGVWGGGFVTKRIARSPASEPGYCVSGKLQVRSADSRLRWMETAYLYDYSDGI